MRTCVVNARFAGMRMTGVQRSAYEIVSRLLLDQRSSYRLYSPRFGTRIVLSLPVEQRGRVRQGHLWEQLELPRLVRKVDSDAVLYSPMTSGPLTVSRQVLTVHDLFPIENPEWYSRAFSTWYGWLWPRLMPKVSRIIANSCYTKQRILERFGLPEDRVVVCRFAQNERFRPTPTSELTRFRAEARLPEDYLLCVASIEPRKNLATLVAAWKQTRAREQGVKLVVAGGEAPRRVFDTASSGAETLVDPTILLVGSFPDENLPLLYGGALAFALPSLAEGFGLPVLEAMACGTPVICSDNTALPEVAGGAARLVPALEAEAWAEAIDSVLIDPKVRQHMRSDGLRRAANFSWTNTARAVRAVLDSA